MKAVVRCHKFPLPPDGRYHYYISLSPGRELLPLEVDSTLKTTASACKQDRVVYEWRTQHYMGYLQGFDDVEEQRPRTILWEEDGTLTVLSQGGVVAQYQIKSADDGTH
jgi:ribulose bisphosphate carboxylase small subunit